MALHISDEREALLEKDVRDESADERHKSQQQQQQQSQEAKMSAAEHKPHTPAESLDETISVGKFEVGGGAVLEEDRHALTGTQPNESPRGGYGDHGSFDNDTAKGKEQPAADPKKVLLPELEMAIYLRDQTIIHLTMEEGRHATAEDLTEVILHEQKLPDNARDIFCLWLISPLLELRLKRHHKPFFLVQQWAGLCDRYTEEDADDIAKDEPMLMFQRDVFLTRQAESQVQDKEALLYLYHEAKFNVLEGRYVVSPEDYHKLAGISALIHLTHFDSRSHIAPFYRASLEQFYPDFLYKKKWSLSSMWSRNPEDELQTQLEAVHRQMSDRYRDRDINSVLPELYRAYLDILYTYPFYGGAFFMGDVDRASRLQFLKGFQDRPIWVAINTDGITLIDREKNEVLLALPFESFSWQYKEAKKVDDPPILYLHFVCPESLHDPKLLIIDSYQARLMDALIQTCVNMKIQSYNSPGDSVDAPLPSASGNSIDPFRKCVNKLERLCLETLTPEGDKV